MLSCAFSKRRWAATAFSVRRPMVWNVACTAILVALLSYVLLLVARYTLGYHFSNWKFWATKKKVAPAVATSSFPCVFCSFAVPIALSLGSPVVARFGSLVSLCAAFPGQVLAKRCPCLSRLSLRPLVGLGLSALQARTLSCAVALQGRRMRLPALEFYLRPAVGRPLGR